MAKGNRSQKKEIKKPKKEKLKGGRITEAGEIFEQMMTSPHFAEFLTLVAYDYID